MKSRGVVLFAHNNGETDYLGMARATAQRAARFLDLPVTLITDSQSAQGADLAVFDKVITTEPSRDNRRKRQVWINRGRHQAYELSPYDQTLLLDVDYMINSQSLLSLFELPTDIAAYDRVRFLCEDLGDEKLNRHTAPIYWATCVRFDRSQRVEQVFNMMNMVENNYEHYSNLYGFQPYTFRNDYALTIALRTVSGHLGTEQHSIPGTLLHVGNKVQVHRNTDTEYVLLFEDQVNRQVRSRYITVRDQDFHMLGKYNFQQLVGLKDCE
jgi:hypothetical protein